MFPLRMKRFGNSGSARKLGWLFAVAALSACLCAQGGGLPEGYRQVGWIGLDGRILRWLVPAKRLSDGKIGLYDAMNDKFYVNQGKGAEFKAVRAGLTVLVQ